MSSNWCGYTCPANPIELLHVVEITRATYAVLTVLTLSCAWRQVGTVLYTGGTLIRKFTTVITLTSKWALLYFRCDGKLGTRLCMGWFSKAVVQAEMSDRNLTLHTRAMLVPSN